MATKFAGQRGNSTAAPSSSVARGPLPVSHDAPRRQRRPAVLAAGLALAAAGALVSAYAFDQAGDRVSVIALAHDVPAGETIEASDLVTAQVAPDPALDPVPVSRKKDVIGKTAAADLPKGTLVTDASVEVTATSTRGKDVVGILAKPGQLPAQRLVPGDEVVIVFTPEADSGSSRSSTPDSISAVVSRVGDPDANNARVVDVAASGTDSVSLAAWAASGNVAIVLKAKD